MGFEINRRARNLKIPRQNHCGDLWVFFLVLWVRLKLN